MDRYGVFSVKDSAGKEEIIYSPLDTIDDLAPERMRTFINGEKYAMKNYRTPFGIKAESFLVGAGRRIAYYLRNTNTFSECSNCATVYA